MSWFFSSQILWGECLFFVASLEPHFHLHSLCLPNSPCLYVFASVWSFFYPERNLGAFVHMTSSPFAKDEVIPRQCSLRTLPSSAVSAKPWVARPISVLQNFAILHCQSESTWNTFVGAISKMFCLTHQLHFLSVRKEWTHLEAHQIWQVFPLHVKSTRTSRCKSFANDSMDRWWSKRWDDNLWCFCFQVPNFTGMKKCKFLHNRESNFMKDFSACDPGDDPSIEGRRFTEQGTCCVFSAPFETGLGMLTLCRPRFKNSRR